MLKKTHLISYALITMMLFTSCAKKTPGASYEKENAGGTGYGTAIKSALYIEDFYYLTVGASKSTVEFLNGSAHYFKENNELLPVYTLNNGDTISLVYENKNNTVESAQYAYTTGETENFFNILVSLGILKSSGQETPGDISNEIPDDNSVAKPSDQTNGSATQTPSNGSTNIQTAIQGDVFASGSYNYTLIEPAIYQNALRSEILKNVGKPSYFFSHSFTENSYIIDCYNLSDGSKLYLDYGFERLNLRCAAIYKNGSYTSILSSSWSVQEQPIGFTRFSVDINRLTRLEKNSTPAKVYAAIGEPAWYEGNRGSYNDVYKLNNGSYAYLNFGSAHNKLTSINIKNEDGSITSVTLNR